MKSRLKSRIGMGTTGDSSDPIWSIWANRFFKWFRVLLVTKVSAVRACTARGGVQLISPFTDAAWRFNTGNARRTRGSSRALSRAKQRMHTDEFEFTVSDRTCAF